MDKKNIRISFIITSLGPGGAERISVRLANLLADDGFQVEILPVNNNDRSVAPAISDNVVINNFDGLHYFSIMRPFKAAFKIRGFPMLPALIKAVFLSLKNLYLTFWPLIQYIKHSKPDVIFTAHYNSPVVFASIFSGRKSKVVITEHIMLSQHFNSFKPILRKFYLFVCRMFYPKADKIIGVSQAVLKDLCNMSYTTPEKSICIYIPVVNSNIYNLAMETCNHPWLQPCFKEPVFAAVGQLNNQKDYPTLLKAFAELLKDTRARLLVLGKGFLLNELQKISYELHISEFVDWLGFVPNQFLYMKASGLFVLSSVYEGLPAVIIEALALGASIAATDSSGGIREILGNDNEYGLIVPVKDHHALAQAMKKNLTHPFDKKILQERAQFFSDEKALENYKKLIFELLN